MEMLKVRNEISHDYDGTILKSYCEKIVENYIDEMKGFEDRVQNLVME